MSQPAQTFSHPGGRPEGVSICIPNWHHRNYLPRSVGSALAAARRLRAAGTAAEVVVVDDASRDGAQRLLFALALAGGDGELDLVMSESNRGQGAMRNLALRHARYRWVCLLDADNELIPENLSLFVRALRDTRAAMVYGNLIAKNGMQIAGLLSNDVLHEAVLSNNYIDNFSVVDADRLLALGGYDETRNLVEDWDMILHLVAEHQDIVFVPAVLGYYHVIDASSSQLDKVNNQHIRRRYDQRRTGFPPGYTAGRIYHPDLGALDATS